MKRYWEQLKPQERRWAVGIGLVVFLMLNYFFVWPHIHDWSRDRARMEVAMRTNQLYRAEIGHKDEYVRKLRELQSDGSSVLPEDQAIDFVHFYGSREMSNRITPLNNGPLITHTNEFFVEQQMGISVQADETNLVNFLYSLSAGNSMMRVRAMSLHPDPSHQQLAATLTLVASYQKKAAARSATGAPAAAPAAPVRPTGVASAAPVKPAAKVTAPVAPAPAPPAKPSPFAANQQALLNSAAAPSNRIAGAFARSNAPPKKPVTTAQ